MIKGYTYILLCSDGSFYTGSTVNINRRLNEHLKGKGAEYTKYRLPVKLVYLEKFDSIGKAYYREKQIQRWSAKKKSALIEGDLNLLSELARKRFRK